VSILLRIVESGERVAMIGASVGKNSSELKAGWNGDHISDVR
jgi:hypothetical protein